MDAAIFDLLLGDFSDAIANGAEQLIEPVNYLLRFFLIITMTLAGLWWAFGNDIPMEPFLKKIMLIGFFVYAIDNWQEITTAIGQSLLYLGFQAGGSRLVDFALYANNSENIGELIEPSRLGNMALDTADMIMDIVLEQISLSGIASMATGIATNAALATNPFTAPILLCVNLIIIVLAALGWIICVVILVIKLILTILEFKIVTMAAVILLPFGLFEKTNFISEKAFPFVVSSSLKMFMLAFLLGVAEMLLIELVFAIAMGPIELAFAFFGVLTLTIVVMFIPGLAGALASGTPTMGDSNPKIPGAGMAKSAGKNALMGSKAGGRSGGLLGAMKSAAGAGMGGKSKSASVSNTKSSSISKNTSKSGGGPTIGGHRAGGGGGGGGPTIGGHRSGGGGSWKSASPSAAGGNRGGGSPGGWKSTSSSATGGPKPSGGGATGSSSGGSGGWVRAQPGGGSSGLSQKSGGGGMAPIMAGRTSNVSNNKQGDTQLRRSSSDSNISKNVSTAGANKSAALQGKGGNSPSQKAVQNATSSLSKAQKGNIASKSAMAGAGAAGAMGAAGTTKSATGKAPKQNSAAKSGVKTTNTTTPMGSVRNVKGDKGTDGKDGKAGTRGQQGAAGANRARSQSSPPRFNSTPKVIQRPPLPNKPLPPTPPRVPAPSVTRKK